MAQNVEDLLSQFDDFNDRLAEVEAMAEESATAEEYLAKVEEPKQESSNNVVTCHFCDCAAIAQMNGVAVCDWHMLNDGECESCHKGGTSTPAPASVVGTSTSPTLSEKPAEGESTTTNSDATGAVEERASMGVLATNQAEYNEEFKNIFNQEFILLQQEDSLVFAEERKDALERFIREAKIKIAAIQGFQDEKVKRARKDELESWSKKSKELEARKPKRASGDATASGEKTKKSKKSAKSWEDVTREQLSKMGFDEEYILEAIEKRRKAKGL